MINSAGRRRLSAAATFVSALAIASVAMAEPKVDKSVKVGPGLYELAFNPTDGDVYVASTGQRGGAATAKIFRMDGATLAAEGAIDTQANPAYGLGINTRTQMLYGTDTRGGAVVVYDLKAGKIAATIKPGQNAHLREVIVDEAANKAYASVVGGGQARDGAAPPPSEVWVIDGAKNTIDRVIKIEGARLTGIALDAAGQRMFGTALNEGQIVVVDLKTDKVVQRWAAGGDRPTNVVYDAAGKRLFVANQGGTLSVLNSDTGAVLKSVATGAGALGVAYNPAVKHVYVTNRGAGTLTVVDSDTYAVAANLDVGTLPQSVVVNRANNNVYVTSKARGAPRNANATPGAPPAPPPEDPSGDTLTLVRP